MYKKQDSNIIRKNGFVTILIKVKMLILGQYQSTDRMKATKKCIIFRQNKTRQITCSYILFIM